MYSKRKNCRSETDVETQKLAVKEAAVSDESRVTEVPVGLYGKESAEFIASWA